MITKAEAKKLVALQNDDFQNRQGEYPQSNVPDCIFVSEWNGRLTFKAEFKNTDHETAAKWTKNFLQKNGFEIEVETRESPCSEYTNDWVTSGFTVEVK